MPIRYLPRLGILMLLPLVGGCGLVLMDGPPDVENPEQLPYNFSCTEGNVGAILDIVVSGASIIAAISAAGSETLENPTAVAVTAMMLWILPLWGQVIERHRALSG